MADDRLPAALMDITRDQLAAALEEFRLAVRTDTGRQESGAVARPDEVADVLHATLSRLAAEFPEKFTTGRAGGGAAVPDDRLSFAMEEIRQTYAGALEEHRSTLDVVDQRNAYKSSAEDVPCLLAALGAVLKLAADAQPVERDYGGEPIWWNITPEAIREAITRALTGSGDG